MPLSLERWEMADVAEVATGVPVEPPTPRPSQSFPGSSSPLTTPPETEGEEKDVSDLDLQGGGPSGRLCVSLVSYSVRVLPCSCSMSTGLWGGRRMFGVVSPRRDLGAGDPDDLCPSEGPRDITPVDRKGGACDVVPFRNRRGEGCLPGVLR